MKIRNLIAITFVFLLVSCSDENSTQSLIEKGDQSWARREYQQASHYWYNALKQEPDNTDLMINLSNCFIKLGNIQKSQSYLEKAKDLDPQNINLLLKLAKLHVLLWNLPDAEKLCNSIENQRPNLPELLILKGDLFVLNNDFQTAEKYYRDAVTASRQPVKALIKLALFLRSQQNDLEADKIFQIVKKSDGKTALIYLLISDYYLIGEQYEEARFALAEALKLEPEDISIQMQLVEYYISIEKLSTAEKILVKLVESENNISILMTLADVYILSRKLEKANATIKKIKKEIREPIAEFELLQGKYWLYSGRPVFAASFLKSALDLKPGLVNARYVLGLTNLINGRKKLSENSLIRTLMIQPDHHDSLLLIALLSYKKKEYNLSIGYIDQFIQKYPENFTGYLIKGLNLILLNRADDAISELYKAGLLSNFSDTTLYYLGVVNEKLKNSQTALDYYEQVLNRSSTYIDVLYRYHNLLIKTGHKNKVLEFINNALTVDDLNTDLYYMAGKLAVNMGDLKKRRALFEKAVNKNDQFGLAYIEMAKIYKENHQIQKAIRTLNVCTEKNPGFKDAWLALSQLYVTQQDTYSAMKVMEKGYLKFQDSAVFQSNLAWLYLENNKDLTRALDLAQQAFEKMPENVAVADTLAWAYFHKGIYSQTIWLLTDAIEKNPDSGVLHYHIGMAFYKTGNLSKTKWHFQKVEETFDAERFSSQIAAIYAEMKPQKNNAIDDVFSDEKKSVLDFSNEAQNSIDSPPTIWEQ